MKAKEILEEKEKIINKIDDLNKELLTATIEYKEVKNNLWLNTDWSEAIGKAKPTVDEKKAYISQQSLAHKELKEIAYLKVQYLKMLLDLLDDKLEFCDE